jgi:hypothetical protein
MIRGKLFERVNEKMPNRYKEKRDEFKVILNNAFEKGNHQSTDVDDLMTVLKRDLKKFVNQDCWTNVKAGKNS